LDDPVLAGEGDPTDVNPHYLKRVLACAQRRKLEAGGDIVAANHARLVPAGTPIDASVLERIRRTRLARPLEDCLVAPEGISAGQLQATALTLVDKFGLILKIDSPRAETNLLDMLGQLWITPPLQALLTLYADEREGKLEHTVCVSLLILALARRLLPGKPLLHKQLALAGLLHDVGELYIEPIQPQRDLPLSPEQWRSIASHPVIGSRVLSRLEGAGPVVAEAVLCHHERLDGFGYPRGLADEDFKLPMQLLAVAEWLAGLLEAGMEPLMRASVAARLIPGEFSPKALEPVHKALRGTVELADWLQAQQSEIALRVRPMAEALQRFEAVQHWIANRGLTASPPLRSVLLKAYQRMHRLQASFAGAGLDLTQPERVLADLQDPEARQELGALLGEFGWRMREMERACLLRASMLGGNDLSVINEMLSMIRGENL
jgi:hypothetical protein